MKTDTELRHEVEHELEWDASVDAGQIGDAVRDGIVTLTGEVTTYAQRWNAERATERVHGVRGVANEITIRASGEHNDTDIAKAAADTLRWNATLPADDVMVKVSQGWVTLTGEVNHEYQRRAAQRIVRDLRGVRGVTDLIGLKATSGSSDLKPRIDASIKRHAAIDAAHITVAVNDGAVTLQGAVRSWAERHDAEETAWSGRGVRSVLNEITVTPV